ncbi:MAG TPA: hypothetical protein VFF79_02995 [Conexibacter sp.]|jgi:hypothetical protein|nr:hypothetical protein [Conexibacter sp.]
MNTTLSDTRSLYEVLAGPGVAASVRGETIRTMAKETVDNDEEALALQEIAFNADR